MGIKDLLLNVVTIGGHGRVQAAIRQYEDGYQHYQRHYQQAKYLEDQIRHTIDQMGQCAERAVRLLQLSQQLLLQQRTDLQTLTSAPTVGAVMSVQKTHHLLESYSSALEASKGAGLGAATAAGSWALVSLLGTASTGTAIGTLSGAAATNATLAWFGGGALAAGGGGMAMGMMTLGGLVALPLIAFSAWSTHNKADEIEQRTEELRLADEKLQQALPVLQQQQKLATQQHQRISQGVAQLEAVYERVRRVLLPIWLLSHLWRLLCLWFGRGYYQAQDGPALTALDQANAQFLALFADPEDTHAPVDQSALALRRPLPPPEKQPVGPLAEVAPGAHPVESVVDGSAPPSDEAAPVTAVPQYLPELPREIVLVMSDPVEPVLSSDTPAVPAQGSQGVRLEKDPR